MNIILSANTSWYLYNFRINTIKAMLKEHNVFIVAGKDVYSSKLEALGCNFNELYISRNTKNPIIDLITIFSFYKHYRKIKPDVIFNFTPKVNIYSVIAAKLFGKSKIINNIAGLGNVFIENTPTTRLLKMMYFFTQPYCDYIFFQNNDDRNLFLKHRFTTIEKSERIPGSGVDLQRFNFIDCKQPQKRFLLVARMLKEKGVYLYVKAAEEVKKTVPDAVFSILGPVDEKNSSSVPLKQLKQWDSEGVINYLGKSDNVEDIIKDYDFVVLPSWYREGVPKSLLEAAAMGKVIITTNNVGCKETVISGITGFLCEPKSYVSLKETLFKAIYLSEHDYYTFSRNARLFIESNFDEKFIIEKYMRFVNE